ncbi:MAG TPA: sigma-70 family RNA polymerase sigma factor [Candidatus Acidoferrales bacterium]|jgi:RNA polymerase sigma-70 factor (ECF subfamily)|nr:sigma-70 family RNA polymerase sigma factor [Candidatus Acidoferrales bacterium]
MGVVYKVRMGTGDGMSDGIELNLPRVGSDEHASPDATLEKVFREQYPRLINLLARITGDRCRAEELASEAFCKLAARPALFRPNHNLEGWLYRTAMNLGLDALKMNSRRRKNEHAAAIEYAASPATGTGPLESLLREEQRRRVRIALAELKPVSARLLLLRYVGFSYRELASTLKINPASVGQLLLRATGEFKSKYSELYEGKT